MDDPKESCRFETTETLAAFVASTPLLSETWKLCNAANASGTIQTQQSGGIWYVALPAVRKMPSGELTALEAAAGEGVFSAFRRSEEPPPAMVDADMLTLFFSMVPLIQPQIMGCMEQRKLVITGHSTGGAMASLTALWLLSHLQTLSSSPSNVLCITFGSPLLGNRSLSTSISRSNLNRNFCHVSSTRDPVSSYLLSPRSRDISRAISATLHFENASSGDGMRNGSEFWPFGSYLFCSEEGAICIDDAASVSKMLVMFNARRLNLDVEEHLKYGGYVQILSQQFLEARGFEGVNVSESSYAAGVTLAVAAMGISHEEPAAAAEARESIEMATRISRVPILKAAELAVGLGEVLPCRLDIQWYKERCDASQEQLGYYDSFKRGTLRRDFKADMSRRKLARFWDRVIDMIEKNELPYDFLLQAKWLYASQFYQLLAEPLDIAHFYKSKKPGERGRHYTAHGNRPKRYVTFDKWWKERPEAHKKKYERTRHASATQDTCFWAKLEEAKECLDDVKRESDGHERSILWEKMVGFERYADELVRKKEVSVDVLAKNSSYMKWVEALREFKSQISPELSVFVEDAAMETM